MAQARPLAPLSCHRPSSTPRLVDHHMVHPHHMHTVGRLRDMALPQAILEAIPEATERRLLLALPPARPQPSR